MNGTDIARGAARRALATAMAACAGLVLLAGSAAAQFPDRPIRLLVGYPPGGSADLVSRLMADAVGPLLGQRVVVENRIGVNGLIAAEAAARAAPDGYTIYQCSMSTLAITPQLIGARVPIDAGTETMPLANVGLSSYGLVVPPGSPFRQVSDILAAARDAPGRLTFASVGFGSAQHLSGELLKRLAGVNMTHVPYRGAAPAVVDLMAGRVDFMITNLADITRQVVGGDLRLLAQGDSIPFPLFPDAPRIAAAAPGFDVVGWFGLCAPRGLPPEVTARWTAAVRQALDDPGVQRRLWDSGLRPHFEGPDAFAARLAADRSLWLGVIREGNVRAE